MKTKRCAYAVLLNCLLFAAHEVLAFYNPQTGRWLSRDPIGERGGENMYVFAGDDPVQAVDILGLLAATVEVEVEKAHGSAEKNGTYTQYVVVDDETRNGERPLILTDLKSAAFVSLYLDEGFNGRIEAWTALSRDKSLTSLNMSTDLNGKIRACCPCPFKRVRANWSAFAAVRGTVGSAHARFDHEKKQAFTTWSRPIASVSGTKEKVLDTSNYCTTFSFIMGQKWVDVSKTTPTVSKVSVQATFECID